MTSPVQPAVQPWFDHKIGNHYLLNRVYNTLYNQSTTTKGLTFVIVDWSYK